MKERKRNAEKRIKEGNEDNGRKEQGKEEEKDRESRMGSMSNEKKEKERQTFG